MQYIAQPTTNGLKQGPGLEMAIIGLGINLGINWAGSDLDEFERQIYQGQLSSRADDQPAPPPPSDSPALGLINALKHARLARGAAVVVVSHSADPGWFVGLDLAITLYQTTGATLLEQLEIAQRLLAETAEIVLVGTVEAGTVGAGSAGIVLAAAETARRLQCPVYATIKAICSVQAASESNAAISEALIQAGKQALAQAQITAAEVGYCELGLPDQQAAEINGLRQVYHADLTSGKPTSGKPTSGDLTCAVGAVCAGSGTFAVAAAASLIKTALCLYYRYIPATPDLSPAYLDGWQNSRFYTPARSKPWFVDAAANQRYAAINLFERASAAHLILAEFAQTDALDLADSASTPSRSTYLAQSAPYLLPLTGADQAELLAALDQLRQTIQTTASLPDTVCQVFAQFQHARQLAHVAAILGQTQAELLAEIELAHEGIPAAFATGKDWKTPMGSYFTAKPLGQTGQLAYVYPGAFNSYVGLGQNLFRLFPALHQVAATYVSDIGAVLRERLLYPRSLGQLSRAQLGQLEEQLMADPLAMLGSGMSYATLLTAALRDYFQLRPQAVFGYSLGEISMICAHAVWCDYDQGALALNNSPLFQSRLAGPMQAVREYWSNQPSSGVDPAAGPNHGSSNHGNDPIWSSYVIRATLPQVTDYVQRFEQVYITHINTSTEIVIAGESQSCLRLTKQIKRDLKCDTFRAPATGALHCDAVRSEYDELVRLNLLPVRPVSGITFYSAANYQPIRLDSSTIAHSIAKGLCQQLDFPRLVDCAYQGGARIFLEVGAGSSCSRWIQEVLQSQPHLVISLNKRGVDDYISIVKALAQLVSHQVPLDLASLYDPAVVQPRPVNLVSCTQTASVNRSISQQPQSVQLNQSSLHHPRGVSMSSSDPSSDPIHPEQISHLHSLHQLQQQKLSANLSQFNQAHLAFLRSRQESLRQLRQISELQLQAAKMLVSQLPDHNRGG